MGFCGINKGINFKFRNAALHCYYFLRLLSSEREIQQKSALFHYWRINLYLFNDPTWNCFSRFSQPVHFSRFKPDNLLLSTTRFSGYNLEKLQVDWTWKRMPSSYRYRLIPHTSDQLKVGFIYTFWCSLLSTSSTLE